MNKPLVADKRRDVITLSCGIHCCPKSLQREEVGRVGIQIIS